MTVSISGIVGTPLGGYLLDVYTRRLKRRIIETDPLLTAQLGLLTMGAQTGLVSLGGSKTLVAAAAGPGGSVGFSSSSSSSSAYDYRSPSQQPQYSEGEALEMQSMGSLPPATPPPARQQRHAQEELEYSPGGTSLLPQPPPIDSTNPFETDIKLNVALSQASLLTLVGAVICAAGVMFGGSSKVVYFTGLAFGALALCCTTAGVNQSVMGSVRPESRSFAVGISTLITHLFGDVPAPVVIGALADELSPPTCLSAAGGGGGGNATAASAVGDSACALIRDPAGLKATLLITTCWLAWPVLLWAAAWCISEARHAARRQQALAAASAALKPGQAEGLFARLMARPGTALREGVRSVLAGVSSLVLRGRGGTGLSAGELEEGVGGREGRGSLLRGAGGSTGTLGAGAGGDEGGAAAGEEPDTEEERRRALAFINQR